ncbi:winged helix-turn-helix domain-containing protein [Methylophaga frappieri]
MWLDMSSHVLHAEDHAIGLARRELVMLALLMRQPHHIFSKQALESQLYSWDEESSANAIEALISRVRRKMREVGTNCRIETAHGLGYRLILNSSQYNAPES